MNSECIKKYKDKSCSVKLQSSDSRGADCRSVRKQRSRKDKSLCEMSHELSILTARLPLTAKKLAWEVISQSFHLQREIILLLTVGTMTIMVLLMFRFFNEKRYEALMEFLSSDKQENRRIQSGTAKRFEVVSVMSQGADYVIMDEPLRGMTCLTEKIFSEVLTRVAEEKETVIVSTHTS